MGFFKPTNQKAPVSGGGFRTLEQGVHKVRITEGEVKRWTEESDWSPTVTLETEDGIKVKFVGLGYFKEVTEATLPLFTEASDKLSAIETLRSEAYSLTDKAAKNAAFDAAKALEKESKEMDYFKTVKGLNALVKFIAAFGKQAYESAMAVDADTVKDTLDAYLKILITSGEAYVHVMEQETVNKSTGKVTRKKNLSQKGMQPQSWAVDLVKEIKKVTDEFDNITHFEVVYKNDKYKPSIVKRDLMTYSMLPDTAIPNDAPNEEIGLPDLPDFGTPEDMPY